MDSQVPAHLVAPGKADLHCTVIILALIIFLFLSQPSVATMDPLNMHATAKKHHAFNWIQQWYTGYILGNSKTGMFLNYHCSWTSFCYLSINNSFWFSFIFTITHHPFITTQSTLILTCMIFVPAFSKYQVHSLASTVGCSHPKSHNQSLSPKTILEDVPTLYRDSYACYSTSTSFSFLRVCCEYAVSDSIAISR